MQRKHPFQKCQPMKENSFGWLALKCQVRSCLEDLHFIIIHVITCTKKSPWKVLPQIWLHGVAINCAENKWPNISERKRSGPFWCRFVQMPLISTKICINPFSWSTRMSIFRTEIRSLKHTSYYYYINESCSTMFYPYITRRSAFLVLWAPLPWTRILQPRQCPFSHFASILSAGPPKSWQHPLALDWGWVFPIFDMYNRNSWLLHLEIWIQQWLQNCYEFPTSYGIKTCFTRALLNISLTTNILRKRAFEFFPRRQRRAISNSSPITVCEIT